MGQRYAEISDLAQLALQSPVLAQVTTDGKNAALLVASERLDGYLRSHFKLPLVAWGGDVRWCVCQWAAYDLVSVRGYNPEAGADVNFRLRAEDATSWAKQVSAGTVTPDVTDNTPAAEPGVSVEAAPRVITASSRGFSSRNAHPGRRTGGGFVGD